MVFLSICYNNFLIIFQFSIRLKNLLLSDLVDFFFSFLIDQKVFTKLQIITFTIISLLNFISRKKAIIIANLYNFLITKSQVI